MSLIDTIKMEIQIRINRLEEFEKTTKQEILRLPILSRIMELKSLLSFIEFQEVQHGTKE